MASAPTEHRQHLQPGGAGPQTFLANMDCSALVYLMQAGAFVARVRWLPMPAYLFVL